MILRIPVDIDQPIAESDPDIIPTLKEMQDFVGGWIELVCVDDESGERQMYVNEEGKLKGLLLNVRATEMFRAVHDTRDFILGPALLYTGRHVEMTRSEES